MAVTRARFPEMEHLGDVTKIHGGAIAPVDIITFGSPCQDLSVAGKQAGIHGGRSGLFHEAIRIIKEMREETHGRYPRYAVWENVAGAFSSNGGLDFSHVLEAFCSVAGYPLPIPEPTQRNGKIRWRNAGIIVGDGFSIAWRTLDAQHWGVPQRRRRIYLVADFGGERAGEILFDPEGMQRHLGAGGEAREGAPLYAEGCANGSVRTETGPGSNAHVIAYMSGQGADAGSIAASSHISPTLRSESGGNSIPSVAYDTRQITSPHNHSNPHVDDPCHTLSADHHAPLVIMVQGNHVDRNAQSFGCGWNDSGVSFTLTSVDRHAIALDEGSSASSGAIAEPVCYAMQGYGDYIESSQARTLRAAHDITTGDIVLTRKRRYVVRRLMPVECARLQGFPDDWGDIEDKRLQSDSAQYRMWGNGLALPCAAYVMRGIAKQAYYFQMRS